MQNTVQRIVVEDELNVPAMLSLEMALMVMVEKSGSGSTDLLFLDDEIFNMFTPGTQMEIHLGLNSPEKVFSGISTSISPRFGDRVTLEIVAFDPLYKLMFGKKSRSFAEVTDSDILSQLVSSTSLTATSDPTTTIYPYIFQNNCSDYDFLLERARRIGFEVLVDEDKLLFRNPHDSDPPAVTLLYGLDLNYFSTSMKTLTEGSETEFRGWDFRNKMGVSGKATQGDENVKTKSGSGSSQKSAFEISTAVGSSVTKVINDSVLDDEEAEILAKARYNEIAQRFITGEGSCAGNPAIRAGKTIEITGVGSRFSGVYYVTSSRHVWEAGAYNTDFKVRRTLL